MKVLRIGEDKRGELVRMLRRAKKQLERIACIEYPNSSPSARRQLGREMLARRIKQYEERCGGYSLLSPRELVREEERIAEKLGIPRDAEFSSRVSVAETTYFDGYTSEYNVIEIDWYETDLEYFERIRGYLSGGIESARIEQVMGRMAASMGYLACDIENAKEIQGLASDLIWFIAHTTDDKLNPGYIKSTIERYEKKYGV